MEQILYEKSEGVATITLNRPERMNAFTDVMIREWAQALEDARLDRDVRAVIVTGAGRGFCAGADLRGGSGVAENANADPCCLLFAVCCTVPPWTSSRFSMRSATASPRSRSTARIS